MSYTEIYAVRDGTQPIEIAEVRNAHRGAMYVWNQVAMDYFGLNNFPFFEKKKQMQIWNAEKTHSLTACEKIVLLSTLDRAAVEFNDIGKLITAFREYGASHPNSSFVEQADAVSEYLNNGVEFEFLLWNQTSINADLLFVDYSEDEEGEQVMSVNLSKIWNIFDDDDGCANEQ